MKLEQIECSETSAYIIQMPGNYPKENIIYSEHGESLKSRINTVICDCVMYAVALFPIFSFYLNLLKPDGYLMHLTGLTFKNSEFSHTV